jgi:hypothetical protein
MDLYKSKMSKKVIHYPSLKTVLMVENVLKNSEKVLTREEIKKQLQNKIMHQTLNVILEYLESRGLIVDTHKGVLWTYNPSEKLSNEINKGMEL